MVVYDWYLAPERRGDILSWNLAGLSTGPVQLGRTGGPVVRGRTEGGGGEGAGSVESGSSGGTSRQKNPRKGSAEVTEEGGHGEAVSRLVYSGYFSERNDNWLGEYEKLRY